METSCERYGSSKRAEAMCIMLLLHCVCRANRRPCSGNNGMSTASRTAINSKAITDDGRLSRRQVRRPVDATSGLNPLRAFRCLAVVVHTSLSPTLQRLGSAPLNGRLMGHFPRRASSSVPKGQPYQSPGADKASLRALA